MCARYTFVPTEGLFLDYIRPKYQAWPDLRVLHDWNFKPSYNAAPGHWMPIVALNQEYIVERAHWGLVPRWASSTEGSSKMINARSETLNEKPSYATLLKSNRCLIPADGFIEWEKQGKNKLPLRFRLKDRELFSMAGLHTYWESADGNHQVHSFTIITCEANKTIGKVHNRMPVILTEEDELKWLDRNTNAAKAETLLKPLPDELMISVSLNPQINDVTQQDNPKLLEPYTAGQQTSLFD